MFRRLFKRAKGESGSPEKNGVVTLTKVEQLIESKAEESDFYELEPVEVLNVFLNADDLPKGDYSYVGAIKGRYIVSEQGKPRSQCGYFKPLNPNMMTYPLRGELVVGVEFRNEKYYTNLINLHGNPNLNSLPGISDLKRKLKNFFSGIYFKKSEDARKLTPYEGDTIIEGKFQNSIRLGSDQYNDNEISPNIKLSAGHLINGDTDKQKEGAYGDGRREKPIFENVDDDGASLYLVTNEKLIFTPGVESDVDGVGGEETVGKTILLDSDRIIFNTKNNGSIGLLSNKNIAISAVEEVVIETPSSKLGSIDAKEPQVLGKVLFDKLDALITQLGLVASVPTPAGPSGPLSSSPGWTAVTSAMADIESALSTKHLIDE